MQSWLTVEFEELDETLLSKHLQLRGEMGDSVWRFEMAGRLKNQRTARHIQYWINLIEKHADGRKALQRLGYRFSLEFVADEHESIAFSSSEIDLLARNHCGLLIKIVSSSKELAQSTTAAPITGN